TKRWPIERFAELSSMWVKTTRGSVLVFSGPGEAPLLETFKNQWPELPPMIQEISELSVRELAALFKVCHLLVGNDAGPRHLAAAVGTPTITLIGPEHPLEWHPYPVTRHPYLFIDHLPCRKDALPGFPPWCGLEVCTVEEHQCMRRITVQEVFN